MNSASAAPATASLMIPSLLSEFSLPGRGRRATGIYSVPMSITFFSSGRSCLALLKRY